MTPCSGSQRHPVPGPPWSRCSEDVNTSQVSSFLKHSACAASVRSKVMPSFSALEAANHHMSNARRARLQIRPSPITGMFIKSCPSYCVARALLLRFSCCSIFRACRSSWLDAKYAGLLASTMRHLHLNPSRGLVSRFLPDILCSFGDVTSGRMLALGQLFLVCRN